MHEVKPFFIIRLCTLDDVPAVEKLIPLSARGLKADVYTTEQIEGALGTVFGVDTQLIRDGTFFVAETEGILVGCGGWSRRKTLFGSDQGKIGEDAPLDPAIDAARIRAFFVHPQWARRGIGREIMKASEEAAIRAGFRRIDIIATLLGEPLYRLFGYQTVRRYDLPLQNGALMPVVHLTKNVEEMGMNGR